MDYRLKDFGKIVKRKYAELRPLFAEVGSDCFRVYDRNLDEYPATVDIYADHVLIIDYSIGNAENGQKDAAMVGTAAANLYIPPENVHCSRRNTLQGHQQHTAEHSAGIELTVTENHLSFRIRLLSHIDTGLFLDHSITRSLVMQESDRKRVLNLFCYTGSFSVYAAAGWAREVVSVDLSQPYLNRAEENMRLNGFTGVQYRYENTDCLTFLQQEIASGRSAAYDLIIMDPPTFSNSRKTEGVFRVQRDYVRYLQLCRKLLAPRGAVLFSTNMEGFRLEKRKLNGFAVTDITKQTIPPGFSRRRTAHSCWILKA